MATEQTLEDVRGILGDALGLGEVTAAYQSGTALLGEVPEFDSMAVVTVITSIEEHFGIEVNDDEIDASTFETVGSLADFVEAKLSA